MGLLGVPRAAAGRAQPVHDRDRLEQFGSRRRLRVGSRGEQHGAGRDVAGHAVGRHRVQFVGEARGQRGGQRGVEQDDGGGRDEAHGAGRQDRPEPRIDDDPGRAAHGAEAGVGTAGRAAGGGTGGAGGAVGSVTCSGATVPASAAVGATRSWVGSQTP